MNTMSDIPGYTVRDHHLDCLGVMALCYRHVPQELQIAIRQGFEAARAMGQSVEPLNLGTALPLSPTGPEEN